ncbi:MAG: glycosyltransferase family 8 protein [Bacteroidales bacterium]
MPDNNKQIFHIACAVDDSFSYPLSVMLLSCLENNRQHNLKIHLFSASLSAKSVELFDDLVTQYGQQFKFYRLNNDVFEGLPVSNRISVASYYRIIMPEHIDPSVEKYLYLDADVIINNDLESLFMINTGDKILAAVNDITSVDMKLEQKHNIPERHKYFNAGVLLINKNNWLKQDAGKRVLRYLKENRELCDYHDQDGLNGALYKDRLTISPVWNQQVGLFFVDSDIIREVYPDDIEKAKRDPFIIHFNGGEKPWNRVSAHPFKKEFKKYARLVNTFNYSEKAGFKKLVKRHLIYGLFGWRNVSRYYYKKTKTTG